MARVGARVGAGVRHHVEVAVAPVRVSGEEVFEDLVRVRVRVRVRVS